MARNKLDLLKQEIEHYIGLPYGKNILKDGKIIRERVLGGKGNWKELKDETSTIAKKEKIDLPKLNKQQLYNFQKKHHIGIDCSGLACQLLNFYFDSKLNPRKISANMLTSEPLSKKIANTDSLKTGDLVRQKNGHHLLFVVDKTGNTVNYVQSSFSVRRVSYGKFDITDKSFHHQGFFRLFFLN